eukprot:PLAT7678.1.p2 GENE.PLAT7678.1~~PLAT7678.1.p2  ORF type:complete len:377 (-),score=143.19 PLAT7678.1:30-1118(-)
MGKSLVSRLLSLLQPTPALWGSVVGVLLLVAVRGMSSSRFSTLAALLVLYGAVSGRTFSLRLKGSTVLVTGASSGIGAAMAVEAARRGAKRVLLVARRREAMEAVKAKVQAAAGGRDVEVLIFPCDIASAEAVEGMGAAVMDAVGDAPDLIINNAGAGAWQHIEEESYDSLHHCMSVPALGALYVTRAFSPAMVSRRSGHVLFVTSAAAYAGIRGAVGYQTSRWAVRGAVRAVRADLAEAGVGVTLLSPMETTDTEYFAEGKAGEASRSRIPLLFALPSAKSSVTTTSAAVASDALAGVEAGRREVHTPAAASYPSVILANWMPDLLDWVCTIGGSGLRWAKGSSRSKRKAKSSGVEESKED